MVEDWEMLNDEQGMWDLVEPDKPVLPLSLWETVDFELKLSETIDIGMKAIDKVHSEMPAPNTIDNLQMKSVVSIKSLDATLDFNATKESDTLDAGMKPLDKRDLMMPPNTIDNVKEKQSRKSVGIIKPLKKEQQSVVIKPVKTVDKELAALLTKWDLDDAAKALAKHGWTTVSLLRQFNPDKHMDELGLSSGKVCGLIALLHSIPFTVDVLYGLGKRLKFEVLPSDPVGDLKRKVMDEVGLLSIRYNLFLSNEKLMDNHSLSSYKIQQNATLLLKLATCLLTPTKTQATPN